MKRAVFLDRDGVLVADNGPLCSRDDARLLDGVPAALTRLHEAGYRLIVVSNQTAVARGLLSLDEVAAIERSIESLLEQSGAPPLDGFYFCPHHPRATLAEYRVDCACRKPRAGLILRASREQDLDLAGSFFVGDRPTDVIAGARAGCKTILVETGQHLAPPIETSETSETASETIEALPEAAPDHVCSNLAAAVSWILT